MVTGFAIPGTIVYAGIIILGIGFEALIRWMFDID